MSKQFQYNTSISNYSLIILCWGIPTLLSQKTYVIYDGIHYDALYQESSSGPICVFDKGDQAVEDQAMVLAHNANKVCLFFIKTIL